MAMRTLSCTEAISPAFERTKLVLFSPFRFGRTWKLAISSYLGLASMIFLPFPMMYFVFFPAIRSSLMRIVFVTCIVVGTVVFCALFYLMTRLEFAFYDILIHRGAFVAPAWRKYGSQSFRWALFKMVIGFPIALLVGYPFVRILRPLMMMKPGTNPPVFPFTPSSFFFVFFAMFFGMMLLLLVGTLLSDFVLPSMVLEDVSIGEAFGRFFVLIRQEPGQMLGFTCLKAILGLIGYYAVILATEIAFLVALGLLFLVGLLIAAIFHAMGVPWMFFQVVGMILLVPCYLGFVFYVLPLSMGCFVTFLQAWGALFLAGRYPLLGEALTQSEAYKLWPHPDQPPAL